MKTNTSSTATDHPPSLGRLLYSMTWPMLFGVVALMGYQLVDSIFISMLGTEPLAALGFTVAVNQIFIGVQVGLGIAITSLIARAMGAKQHKRARNLAGLILIAGSTLMALLVIGVWLGQTVIYTLLDAEEALWPLISRYWLPWLISIWVSASLYFAYSIARARGNTKLPGTVMIVTSLLNIVLDPLFMFGFGWGLPGAALATIAALSVGGIMMARALKRHRWVRYQSRALPAWPALGELAHIALPAMLSQLMPGIAAMIATAIVAHFGAPAVAAWALTTRLEFFSIVIVLALTMSLPPMVGRLYGAQDYATIHQLVSLAIKAVLVIQIGIGVFWALSGLFLPNLLSNHPEVRQLLRLWLWLVPFSFGALGTTMIVVSTTNALGLPGRAVLTSLLRLFACYLPALWVGAQLGGMSGLYMGVFAGNLAAGAVAWLIYRRALWQLSEKDR